jgi:hypothetical protein
MSTTIITTGPLNRLRRRAQRAAWLPLELPPGWSRSPTDPGHLLAAFPALRLRPGFALRAYVFRQGYDGNGIVWALPEHAPFPEPDTCLRLDAWLESPRPPGALDDVMEAIDGDGSPLAYLSAALLARELAEFGACWHGVSWGACHIVGRRPAGVAAGATSPAPPPEGGWTRRAPVPSDLAPRVTDRGDAITVQWHVMNPVGRRELRRLTDTFAAGSYRFTTETEVLAVADGGIVW